MSFLIYSLVGLSVFKLIIDALGGNLIATYSVFIENVIFAIILTIIIRTSIKQKQGAREALLKNIEELKKQVL
jgi:hypothetical protein